MLLSNFNLLTTAPGGVARLRELILTLAVQGQLVPQDPADEPASVLLQRIRAEKDRLIAEGKIKRDKPLAAMGEEEKPFALPQGWEWVRLGSLLPFRIGKTPPSKDPQYWADSGHAWVSISDMNHFGEVAETGRKITDRGACVFGYEPLPSGTLIMSFKLTIGKISVLRVPAYHNEAIVSFTPLDGLDSAFLKYMLPTVAKTGASKDALMGATLNTESLSNLVIALPPQSEQSRIVARVEELMRLCDALEAKGQLEATQHAQLVGTLLGSLTASAMPEELAEHWQRVAEHFDLLLDRPEAIDALEQTLLQLAVRGLLVPQDPQDEPASALLARIRAEKDRLIAEGKIKRDKPLPAIAQNKLPCDLPDGWVWARLSELGDFSGGKTPSTQRADFWDGDIPWITPKDMKQLRLSSSEDKVTQMAVDDGLALIPAHSVLIVVRSGILRRTVPTALNEVATTINQDLKALILVCPELATYVQLLIQGFESFILQNLTKIGTTVESIQFEAFAAQGFPLPPLPEQSRIVARVSALRQLCADLRQRLAERQSVQSRLAEALVAQAGG